MSVSTISPQDKLFDAYSTRPADLTAIARAGYKGIIAYADEEFDSAKVATLSAAKLGILLVYESSAARALQGYAAGVIDGQRSRNRAAAVGYPLYNCPIFAAVDVNVSPWQHADLLQYFRGFKDGGVPIVGAYAESAAAEFLLANDAISYVWVPGAMSWSDWNVTETAHVLQLVGSPHIGGIAIDENLILRHIPLWTPWSSDVVYHPINVHPAEDEEDEEEDVKKFPIVDPNGTVFITDGEHAGSTEPVSDMQIVADLFTMQAITTPSPTVVSHATRDWLRGTA